MRWAHGRAGWALLAAGSFGISAAAAAPLFKSNTAQPPAKAAPAAPASDQARLAAIRVELAWLTDPSTFPCLLAVHPVGNGLEIGGVVPSEELRHRVLQVAGDQGKLPVVDKLAVKPETAPAPTAPRPSNTNLVHAAADALTKTLEKNAAQFEVAADPRGYVTVTGSVPSCEDKLKASRRLSQVPGCVCVVNNMVVARTVRNGKPFTKVTADGQCMLPGEPRDLLPNLPSLPSVAPSAPHTAPVVKSLPAPTGKTNQVPAPSPAPQSQAAPRTPPTVTPVVYQTADSGQVPSSTAVRPAAPAPLPQNVTQAAPLPPKAPTTAPSPYSTASQQPTKPATPPASTPATASRVPTPPANPTTSNASANVVAQAPAPTMPQTGAVRPVSEPAPPARAHAGPGFSAPAYGPSTAQPAHAAPAPPAGFAGQVKRSIEMQGGDSIRDVTVRLEANNNVRIGVKVRSAPEGQRIGERIMNMPELGPYHTDLEMEVVP
jgi:hypothetical protein